MKIIRIFPRKTTMTPDDSLVVFNRKPCFVDEADEIHISVTFTADLPLVDKLVDRWKYVAPVKVGGPALDDFGDEFIPGRYIKVGNVITSRGCFNNCWFCDAWKREGRTIRELPINDGWNLLDNNIFACSIDHQEKVYQMLLRQKERPRFTGGLEAARLTNWNAEWLRKLNSESMYFAYDEPKDYEPLAQAARLLREYGVFKGHAVGCYVLIGYNKDSFADAEKRLINTMKLGYMPQAMLLNRGDHFDDYNKKQWRKFQRLWANKIIVGKKMMELRNNP